MEQNRYEKFIEALGQSERYVNVFRKYFCTASVDERQKDNNGKPVTIYVFSLGRAKDAQEFYKRWFGQCLRLENELKSPYPYANIGLQRTIIKRDLAHGRAKYNDLHFFYTREPIFKELELMFPNQMGAVYCSDESSEPAKQYIINSLQKQFGISSIEPSSN